MRQLVLLPGSLDLFELKNYTSFKNNIKPVYSNLQVVPPCYIEGDRKLSVRHACLRNNCSNLKHDLYTNFKISDNISFEISDDILRNQK